MADGFPRDDYTPHGYLRNHHAGETIDGEIPQLRSLSPIGFEWRLTGHVDEIRRAGLRIGLRVGDRQLRSPADFEREGVVLVSRYHTSRAQSFDFSWLGHSFEATFFLADRDALACRVRLNGMSAENVAVLAAAGVARAKGNAPTSVDALSGIPFEAWPGAWWAIAAESRSATSPPDDRAGGLAAPTPVTTVEGWVALGRGEDRESALASAHRALVAAPDSLAALLAEDDAFWSHAPRLDGDWPDHWRRGWVYDLETTRLVVFPPAGVFAGPWPSWMLNHPRVVLAESSLDMLRLALADPELAWSALETVFDAAERIGAPQIPCLLPDGTPDMVAEDGSVCGTSPAWCLPFHNLRLLYRLDPDHLRLARLYPRLTAYVEWWLANRADDEGWLGYRCSWESGEDESPRLDPERRGERVIQGEVRPVELQAAVAQSAAVLADFAEALGREADVIRWEMVRDEYSERTRRMWDAERGQFGDHDPAGRLIRRDAEYWGTTVACDALQLLPLLDRVATPEQSAVLAARLDEFDSPPWTLWPSWSWTVAEAARAVGRNDLAGRLAAGVIDRVYRENDRRDLAPHSRPLPGVAREYWPLDLGDFRGNEAYGWGANTLQHLLRHVVGFGPGPTSEWSFELAPCLPPDLAADGAEYRVANIVYRGARLEIALRPLSRDQIEIEVLSRDRAGAWRVVDGDGRGVACAPARGNATSFVARRGKLYVIGQSSGDAFDQGGTR